MQAASRRSSRRCRRARTAARPCPGLTFLQLLFGYRTLDELQASFVDCWTEGDDERSLVLALFPRQPSRFLPVS